MTFEVIQRHLSVRKTEKRGRVKRDKSPFLISDTDLIRLNHGLDTAGTIKLFYPMELLHQQTSTGIRVCMFPRDTLTQTRDENSGKLCRLPGTALPETGENHHMFFSSY